jgi:hypothetical protein
MSVSIVERKNQQARKKRGKGVVDPFLLLQRKMRSMLVYKKTKTPTSEKKGSDWKGGGELPRD